MPNRKKVERSANYSYYSDLLWCTVPLIGMSWYYYGARPPTCATVPWPRCTARATSLMSRPVSALPRSSCC